MFANRNKLIDKGFYYPLSGLRGCAHHNLALALNPKGSIRKQLKLEADDDVLIQRFIDEISQRDERILVSSEGFQNINFNRNLAAKLSKVFPKEQTLIIIYIREQLDYLLSSYTQAVHARNVTLSLEEFEEEHFSADYYQFLQDWSAAFGVENISVHIYDRQKLKNQNIIDDFLDVLTLDQVNFNTSLQNANPSIGGNLLNFKRLLNQMDFNPKNSRKLYHVLEKLAEEHEKYRHKPQVSQELETRVRQKYRLSNQQTFKTYFKSQEDLFNYKSCTYQANPDLNTDLNQDIEEIIDFIGQKDISLVQTLAIEFAKKFTDKKNF
ncbi:MAG: hypothetical protein R2880_00445 [Deinococcales bacterium]